MTISYICDGCEGAIIAGDVTIIGQVIQWHYCAACTPVAAAYIASINIAHDEAVAVFRRGIDQARTAARLKRLPDTNDD